MTRLDIHELRVPERMTDPDSGEFAEMVALANGIERDTRGQSAAVYAPEDLLPAYQGEAFDEPITFVARLGPIMVGIARIRFPLEETAVTATVDVSVAGAVRGRGVGSALLGRAEEMVAAGGRTTVVGTTHHAEPPARSPVERFLRARGYRLAQVERMSACPLPEQNARSAEATRRARAEAGTDYRPISWQGRVPDDRLGQFAALRARMAADAPRAGATIDVEEWTGERVREFEAMMVSRRQPLLTTALVHEPTNTLVAYTEIVLPSGSREAEQHDTLVMPDHRGRGLGILVKAENLRQLRRVAPGVARVLTWNAVENDRMLAVNDELGFEPLGYTGTWEKRL